MRSLVRAAAPLLAAACLTAQAQTIYRCGDSYSQQPCAGGQLVPTAPAPSAADRAQAGANARRDATLAATLEKDRVRQENQAAAQPLYLPPPPAEPVREGHKWPEQNATRKLDVFTASAPGTPAKKNKDGKKGKSGADTKADTKSAGTTAGKTAKAAAAPEARVQQIARPAPAGGSS
jgi:hypothetical protein